ncbi:MAG: NUDIX hydrolase [Bdellovibrionota bacterium]
MHKESTKVIVSGVVIKKDGRYLLVQEKQPKVYGKWNFPAGWIDKNETPEQAALREAKEETGLEVELVNKLGVFEGTSGPTRHTFEAKIIGGELKVQPEELLDIQWFTFDEITGMKDQLRSDWILWAVSILEK